MPSGVWAQEEYDRLEAYDNETFAQPAAVFLCHQTDRGSPKSRVCAGWAGCHDGANLLALRFAASDGRMSGEDVDAVIDYVSPVPLFDSGADAADHGRAEIHFPRPRARTAIARITRRRSDLRE